MKKMLARVKAFRPNVIVQIGDLFDFYNFSRFPKSSNVATPHSEIRDGRWMAERFWTDVKKLSPLAQCFQAWGNHEERPFKRIMEKAPELEKLFEKPLRELLIFPGVTTLGGPQDELDINGIRFIHGWSCKPGFHMNYFGRSVAHGHTHKGGVEYLRKDGKTIFELDCGVLADFNSRPLIYRSSVTCRWTPGFGVIDPYGPRFCPL